MIRNVATQGIGLSVTPAIQEQADQQLLELAKRYDANSVKLTFSVVNKQNHVLIEYHDPLVSRTVRKTGPEFYGVLKAAAKSLRQAVTSSHKKVIDQKRRHGATEVADEAE